EPRKEEAPGEERKHRRERTGREDALARLDTRPVRRERAEGKGPGKPAGSFEKRGKPAAAKGARAEPSRPGAPAREKEAALHSRAANVWRAPGARPLGPQKLEKLKKRKVKEPGEQPRGTGRPKPRGGHADRRR